MFWGGGGKEEEESRREEDVLLCWAPVGKKREGRASAGCRKDGSDTRSFNRQSR